MKNKDTKLIILLAFFAIVGMVTMFSKCEKVFNPSEEEVIDTTIYDKRFRTWDWAERDLVDTLFDLVFIGSNYKGNSGLNLFLSDVDSVRPVINYIESFSGHPMRITLKNSKQNLQCNDNAIGNNNVETIVCNEQKIINIVNDISLEFFNVDAVCVFVNGKGHGSHSGAQIFIIGTGNHTSTSFCYFYEGLRKKFGHEFGHRFGLQHENTTLHFMNDGVNGGCAAGDTYTSWQQQIIINYMDSIINP